MTDLTFDLVFMLRRGIPARDALTTLQAAEQTMPVSPGGMLLLRPSGEGDWQARAERAEADAAALRQAAIDLTNQLAVLRFPDESTLWRLGGKDLERDYQALRAALTSDAGQALLAELAALRAALTTCERAINESVSGIRKIGIPEWSALLVAAQAALGGKGGE